MTREEAHRLLDGARNGVPVSSMRISEALMETGDLDCSATTQLVISQAQWSRAGGALLSPADIFDGLMQ